MLDLEHEIRHEPRRREDYERRLDLEHEIRQGRESRQVDRSRPRKRESLEAKSSRGRGDSSEVGRRRDSRTKRSRDSPEVKDLRDRLSRQQREDSPETNYGKNGLGEKKRKPAREWGSSDLAKKPRRDNNQPVKVKSCVIPGCGTQTRNVRRHANKSHVPRIFLPDQIESRPELDGARLVALRDLGEILLGEEVSLLHLLAWVNQQGFASDIVVVEQDQGWLRRVAQRMEWEGPAWFTLVPCNSRALLFHWRPLMLMISHLEMDQRRQWMDRVGRNHSVSAPDRTIQSHQRQFAVSDNAEENEEDEWSDGSIQPNEFLEMDCVGYEEEDDQESRENSRVAVSEAELQSTEQQSGPSFVEQLCRADNPPEQPVAQGGSGEERPVGFDSHFHLDRSSDWILKKPDGTLEELLAVEVDQAQCPVDVRGGVAVFCDPETYPEVFPRVPGFGSAVGIHPKKVAEFSNSHLDILEELLRKDGVVALGEVGIDHTAPKNTWQRQEEVLREVLLLSMPRRPLVLHVRDRNDLETGILYTRVLKIMKECAVSTQKIHLHCFTGSAEQVVAWLDAFPETYFGFTNIARKFTKPQKAGLRQVPVNRLLLETDAPYFGGEGGSTPAFLGKAADVVSQVRGVAIEELIRRTALNGRILYRL